MPQPHSTRPDVLEGELQSVAVTAAAATQIFVGAALLAIAALGAFFIALSFHPTKVPNQWTFGALGALLIGLCGLGFYFIVIRPWLGGIACFRIEGGTLRYRKIFGGEAIGALSLASVEEVSDHLPDEPFSAASSWVKVCFRSGETLKIHPNMLSHANELIERCRETCRQRVATAPLEYASSISLDAPELADLRAELAEGERVLWIGGPATAKYWSEIAASFVFGALLTIPMLAALILLTPRIWEDPSVIAFLGTAVMLGFLTLGLTLLWTPWRCRRQFAETIYCVTDRRAVVIRGYYWGQQMHATRTDATVQSYDNATAGRYQLDSNGRDIVFHTELRHWKRRNRHRQYVLKFGFLCVDDPRGAEAALARLRTTGGEIVAPRHSRE